VVKEGRGVSNRRTLLTGRENTMQAMGRKGKEESGNAPGLPSSLQMGETRREDSDAQRDSPDQEWRKERNT